MKAQDFQNLLAKLRITKSYSRPRVSNDNPYSEALFKTLKYVKDFKGFSSMDEVRKWVHHFVHQYNEFLHSGIKYVTPYQRHYGLDIEILAKREKVTTILTNTVIRPYMYFCPTIRDFTFGFLLISSYVEHPCSSANSSYCQVCSGLSLPSYRPCWTHNKNNQPRQ